MRGGAGTKNGREREREGRVKEKLIFANFFRYSGTNEIRNRKAWRFRVVIASYISNARAFLRAARDPESERDRPRSSYVAWRCVSLRFINVGEDKLDDGDDVMSVCNVGFFLFLRMGFNNGHRRSTRAWERVDPRIVIDLSISDSNTPRFALREIFHFHNFVPVSVSIYRE